MAAIATDITEWTRVQAALAERQRLLDTVIRACPDIVTVLDGNGRVREISEASARILGYDLHDPVHEEIEALIHPDDIDRVHDEAAKIFSRARHPARPHLPGPPCRWPLGRARHPGPGDGGRRRHDGGSRRGGPRRDRRARGRSRDARRGRGRRAGQQGQERLPVPDEPRAADPAQQRVGLLPAPRDGRPARQPRRGRRPHHAGRSSSPEPDRRGPRHRPDRVGQSRAPVGARGDPPGPR